MIACYRASCVPTGNAIVPDYHESSMALLLGQLTLGQSASENESPESLGKGETDWRRRYNHLTLDALSPSMALTSRFGQSSSPQAGR